MNILIVDDERIARFEMVRQIESLLPDAVTHQAEGVSAARAVLHKTRVDCVLLDLEMPGGHGMDFLPELNTMGVPVIIITGYGNFAVESYEHRVTDYLLKPVEPARLGKALAKIRREAPDAPAPDVVLLNDQNHCWPVSLSSVVMIEASGSYVTVRTTNGEDIVLSRNLKEVQQYLDERYFIRCNRSQIVRLEYLGAIRKMKGGGLVAEVNGGTVVTFSRRQAAAFRARFRF
jgi:two-component system LytT family response regulator